MPSSQGPAQRCKPCWKMCHRSVLRSKNGYFQVITYIMLLVQMHEVRLIFLLFVQFFDDLLQNNNHRFPASSLTFTLRFLLAKLHRVLPLLGLLVSIDDLVRMLWLFNPWLKERLILLAHWFNTFSLFNRIDKIKMKKFRN